MYIGLIIGYSEKLKTGCLLLLSSNLGKIDLSDRLCQFSILDLKTIIYDMKIVMVEDIRKIEFGIKNEFCQMIGYRKKCKYQGFNIHDEYPKFTKDDFIDFDNLHVRNDSNRYYKEFLLGSFPFVNESLTNFFIQNEMYLEGYYSGFFGSMQVGERAGDKMAKINKLLSLQRELSSFSIDKAIESFDVCIHENTRSRSGKDDTASISIVSKRDYWTYRELHITDPYIEELFSIVEEKVASTRAFTNAHTLLRGLWDGMGGESKARKILEKKCIDIKTKKIDDIKNTYSLKLHREFIMKEISARERDLRGWIEYKRRELDFYFSENETTHHYVNKKKK